MKFLRNIIPLNEDDKKDKDVLTRLKKQGITKEMLDKWKKNQKQFWQNREYDVKNFIK